MMHGLIIGCSPLCQAIIMRNIAELQHQTLYEKILSKLMATQFSDSKKRGKNRQNKSRGSRSSAKTLHSGTLLYGQHAVLAALHNPARTIKALYHCQPLEGEAEHLARSRGVSWQMLSREEIDGMLYSGSLHQGLVALVEPLEDIFLEDFLPRWQDADKVTLVILDQVADARNLGAILRSAYCLGADAVLCTDRHSAHENGHLAKTASGALEAMPLIRLTNLARALDQLKEIGFWCYGFDGEANTTLAEMQFPSHTGLLFGAEGSGLRRLSVELCDGMLSIPHNPDAHEYGVDSLNLAQSVSIALYARGC